MTKDTKNSPHATQYDEMSVADLGHEILRFLGPMTNILELVQELREELDNATFLGPDLVIDTREVLEIGNALYWRGRDVWDPEGERGRESIAEIVEFEGWVPKGYFSDHPLRIRRRPRRRRA